MRRMCCAIPNTSCSSIAWQGVVAVDVKTAALDARGTLTSRSSPKGWAGAPPYVALSWRGPMAAPLRDLVGLIDARIAQLEEQGDTSGAAAAAAEPAGDEPQDEGEVEAAPQAAAGPEPAPEAETTPEAEGSAAPAEPTETPEETTETDTQEEQE